MKTYSAPSETPSKDTSHVPKEFTISKTINVSIGYSSEYPIGAPRTMTIDQSGTNTRAHTRSDPDDFK